MKKLSLCILVMACVVSADAQLSPVTWSFTAKKISDKMYEVHMKATIQPSWHLYSQDQPDDAIAIPTAFSINKNPLFSLEGKVKEVGKMEVVKDASLGISAHQYATSVDFVQKVKLKANVKTNLTGNVEFQTCDDKKCLPPKKVSFSISL